MPFGIISESPFTLPRIPQAASIYFSSGGGFLGGESHESIRTAAKEMVAAGCGVPTDLAGPLVHIPCRAGGGLTFTF